jgi:hypothetical protein
MELKDFHPERDVRCPMRTGAARCSVARRSFAFRPPINRGQPGAGADGPVILGLAVNEAFGVAPGFLSAARGPDLGGGIPFS